MVWDSAMCLLISLSVWDTWRQYWNSQTICSVGAGESGEEVISSRSSSARDTLRESSHDVLLPLSGEGRGVLSLKTRHVFAQVEVLDPKSDPAGTKFIIWPKFWSGGDLFWIYFSNWQAAPARSVFETKYLQIFIETQVLCVHMMRCMYHAWPIGLDYKLLATMSYLLGISGFPCVYNIAQGTYRYAWKSYMAQGTYRVYTSLGQYYRRMEILYCTRDV